MTTAQLIALERQIAADRERLHIAPVHQSIMPPWARKRLLAVIGQRSLTTIEARMSGPRLLDHWGMSPSGGLVGEPYAKVDDPALIAKVQQIADGLGVSYSISSPWTSWHYPGQTIRVEWYETPMSMSIEQLRAAAKAAKKRNECLLGIAYSDLPPSM